LLVDITEMLPQLVSSANPVTPRATDLQQGVNKWLTANVGQTRNCFDLKCLAQTRLNQIFEESLAIEWPDEREHAIFERLMPFISSYREFAIEALGAAVKNELLDRDLRVQATLIVGAVEDRALFSRIGQMLSELKGLSDPELREAAEEAEYSLSSLNDF